jgi:hypothetical protein
MATIMAILTSAIVLLGVVTPVLGQGQPRAGGVVDVLTDVLGLDRTVRGHVVQHREGTLVLRGDDDRTYTINTAGLDAKSIGQLKDGRPVTVSLKSGDRGAMPIAAAVEAGQGSAKAFQRVEGTVESVNGDQITFGTREGTTIVVDRSRIVGQAPMVATGETATLVYEQEPQLAGVWLDSREIQPSASVPSGAYQRVHGYVQSLGLGTLTLESDDGRTLTIDTTQVTEPPRVRPGDVVSVVGKASGDRRDRFVAELIQPDAEGPAAAPRWGR